MENKYLSSCASLFCKGCSHNLITSNLGKALERTSFSTKDVIVVTDIGCHGTIDKAFNTHTIHGLHGRSPSLAAGISMALNDPKKKVIVIIGDGGSTIGLQHLMDGAVKNINMTVIIHNNMLYGMTGGQISGLTPACFKTANNPNGSQSQNYDISSMLANAGGSYVRRIVGVGDFSEHLYDALMVSGFSALEIMEICPTHGLKHNGGKKVADIIETAGMEVKLFSDKARPIYEQSKRDKLPSLFDDIYENTVKYKHKLKKPLNVVISGSAGEGTQLATELFAHAAFNSGLKVTKRGSYPVTVGTGFSTAELILSPSEVFFTGISSPDILVITSQDGLKHSQEKIAAMKKGLIIVDSSLNTFDVRRNVKVLRYDLRNTVRPKSVSFLAIYLLLNYRSIIPPEAFIEAIHTSKIGKKFDFIVLENAEKL